MKKYLIEIHFDNGETFHMTYDIEEEMYQHIESMYKTMASESKNKAAMISNKDDEITFVFDLNKVQYIVPKKL